jgi:hypothetical protein
MSESSPTIEQLSAEVAYLRACLANTVTRDYLEQALLAVYVAIEQNQNGNTKNHPELT